MLKRFLYLISIFHLFWFATSWATNQNQKSFCEDLFTSEKNSIIAPQSWDRVGLSKLKKNPYLLIDQPNPIVLTLNGLDLMIAIEASKIQSLTESLQNSSDDPVIKKWLNRISKSWRSWELNKDNATGMATIWNDTDKLKEIPNSIFFRVYDERLHDRITQQGRKIALISLNPMVAEKSDSVVTNQRVSISAVAKKEPLVPNTVGLITQRFSSSKVLTMVEDNTFDSQTHRWMRADYFKKTVDDLIDKNLVPLSSVQEPKYFVTQVYSRQLTLSNLLDNKIGVYQMVVFRYRDSRNTDH